MITFLPYPNIRQSLEALDRQRLGRQRLEAWQIYDAVTDPHSIYRGTIKGPAVRMWIGHEATLAAYYNMALKVWTERGYRNDKLKPLTLRAYPGVPAPVWWGGSIHASHRANLIRKLPDWYGQFGWAEEPSEKYYWPV